MNTLDSCLIFTNSHQVILDITTNDYFNYIHTYTDMHKLAHDINLLKNGAAVEEWEGNEEEELDEDIYDNDQNKIIFFDKLLTGLKSLHSNNQAQELYNLLKGK